MPTLNEQLEQSNVMFREDVQFHHQVIRGDENTEVEDENGPMPSLRKRVKDVEQEWSQNADPLAAELSQVLATSKTHKEDAEQAVTDATQQNTQAQQHANNSEQSRQASETAMNNVIADEGSTTRAFVNMTAAVIRTNTTHLDYLLATQQSTQQEPQQ